MTKPKHTPGPWRKQGNIIFGNAIGTSVCKLYTQHIPNEKSGAVEERANAQLIAAAPDMLEALEIVFELIDSGQLVRDISKDHESDFSLKMLKFVPKLQLINKAITKANGDL